MTRSEIRWAARGRANPGARVASLLIVVLTALCLAGPGAAVAQGVDRVPAGLGPVPDGLDDFGDRADRQLKDPARVFVSLVLDSWESLYAKRFKDEYRALTPDELVQDGLRTYDAVELADDDYTPMFAMIMLNWQARMMGASTAFIDDATRFFNDSASMYAVRWYEYQLNLLARERRGDAGPALSRHGFRIRETP